MSIRRSDLIRFASLLERVRKSEYAAAGIVELSKRGWLLWFCTFFAAAALFFAISVGADTDVALCSCFAAFVQHVVMRLRLFARFLRALFVCLDKFFTLRFFCEHVLQLDLSTVRFFSRALIPAAPLLPPLIFSGAPNRGLKRFCGRELEGQPLQPFLCSRPGSKKWI